MQKNTDIKNRFIVDEDLLEKDSLNQLTEKLLKWVKVTKKGEIIFQPKGQLLSPDNKLRFALIARYIGHCFSKEISAELKVVELRNIINESSEATGSRMSKLGKKEGFARKIRYGTYAVRPHQIKEFIEEMESKDAINS
ncbi:MAG: hypothetical protein KJI72_03830 [Patescibacteria group bacterium]|nr:hypothetical protein [Patescibacteria group bacterium]